LTARSRLTAAVRLGRRLCRRGACGGHVLALAREDRDPGVHRHIVGVVRHQNLGQNALIDRLDLHGGLIGLDLGQDIAWLHLLALGLQPLGELALLHRGREGGHQDVGGHRQYLLGTCVRCRCAAG
jgi:hypothetical protein